MIDREQFDRLTRALPVLQHASPQLAREFAQAAWIARIPAGRDVFVEGDRVDAIALLISGVVRVYKVGETGREITLYRFGLGESCILTANAILSQQSFPAIATVEQEAEAVMIPAEAFRDWVRRHDLWRSFVFDLLAQRLSSVMALVDEVAFRRRAHHADRCRPGPNRLGHAGPRRNHRPRRGRHRRCAAAGGPVRRLFVRPAVWRAAQRREDPGREITRLALNK